MPQTPQDTRREYVDAFVSTMTDIWRERLVKLRALRTCNLFSSVTAMTPVIGDPDVSKVFLQFRFSQYGHYLQRGVGKEIARGNGGDIHRAKVRRRKEWFQPKWQGSIHNIREFYARSFSRESIAIINTALTVKTTAP